MRLEVWVKGTQFMMKCVSSFTLHAVVASSIYTVIYYNLSQQMYPTLLELQ